MEFIIGANEAGGANAHRCTLFIVERESAKLSALCGLEECGQEFYGVFVLTGKPLNVRSASPSEIARNAVLRNLMEVLGLQYELQYDNDEELRTLKYGKVSLMMDMDSDGHHIRGLLINMLHTFWPKLLQHNFIEIFKTPLYKATKATTILTFYSEFEFEHWYKVTFDSNEYEIKYCKGFGTFGAEEVRVMFNHMDHHRVTLKYNGPEDDEAIINYFSTDNGEWMRDWINSNDSRASYFQRNMSEISYANFVNGPLHQFAYAINVRTIPNLIDGFKASQRKILFTCFKRNYQSDMNLVIVAGAVNEITSYNHGNMLETIVKMGQNFMGKNNINLLASDGQYGTRNEGGKDRSDPRYLTTKLTPLARLIFPSADDPILEKEIIGGKEEPVFLLPIIPMILVNGQQGRGKGWKTQMYNHNPIDVIANVRRMINGQLPEPMHPWYKNFKGSFEKTDDCYICSGKVQVLEDNKIHISELPIGTWTKNYRQRVLEPKILQIDGFSLITEYHEHHRGNEVSFVITLREGELGRLLRDGTLFQEFQLTSTVIYHINAFDGFRNITHYQTTVQILKEFFAIRLNFYNKRYDNMIATLEAEILTISEEERGDKVAELNALKNSNSRMLWLEDLKMLEDKLLQEEGWSQDQRGTAEVLNAEAYARLPEFEQVSAAVRSELRAAEAAELDELIREANQGRIAVAELYRAEEDELNQLIEEANRGRI